MSLKLTKRNGSDHWYIRGTVRGKSVFETSGTNDKAPAEEIRIKREAQLLEESIHGRTATVTFAEAASSYIASGGSARFLGEFKNGTWTGLIGEFGMRKLNSITQSELDAAGVRLFPNTQHTTRNRQCHAPFISVWNHAVRNKWATTRQWARPRKPKGTMLKFTQKKVRAGTKPVAYERAAKFVLAMSPAPAMLMTTFFYTGMRPIELFTLEDNQVSVKNRCMGRTDEDSNQWCAKTVRDQGYFTVYRPSHRLNSVGHQRCSPIHKGPDFRTRQTNGRYEPPLHQRAATSINRSHQHFAGDR